MNRLKELRQKNHLTLKKLGDEINMPNNTLSQYENGKREPKQEVWQKLADYFNVSVPYAQGNIDTELIAKIAKMVFLIETTPFYTDCGFTNNLAESSKMVCNLMMLLLKQINSNCGQEFKNIILDARKVLNDKRFENIYCDAKAKKPVSYQKAKQCIEQVSGISDRNNFESTIKDAKTLIDFYDKL